MKVKKLLIILFVLLMMLFSCGHKYSTTEIVVSGKTQNWSENDVDRFLDVLNNAKWEDGRTKTAPDYVIELSDGSVLYCILRSKQINDITHDRHMFLSDSECKWLSDLLSEAPKIVDD